MAGIRRHMSLFYHFGHLRQVDKPEKDKLAQEVGDLNAKEKRAKELRSEIEGNQEKVVAARSELASLEARAGSLTRLLQKQADRLGISLDELDTKLTEAVSLDAEIAGRRKDKSRLEGEIEALTERQEKLSPRLEKASADFQKDLKLIKEMEGELAETAEMTGRYDEKIENMEWAKSVLPFLSDPDKVSDDDLSLIFIVVNCVDKWIQQQPQWQRRPYTLPWEEIKRLVQSKRMELR